MGETTEYVYVKALSPECKTLQHKQLNKKKCWKVNYSANDYIWFLRNIGTFLSDYTP